MEAMKDRGFHRGDVSVLDLLLKRKPVSEAVLEREAYREEPRPVGHHASDLGCSNLQPWVNFKIIATLTVSLSIISWNHKSSKDSQIPDPQGLFNDK